MVEMPPGRKRLRQNERELIARELFKQRLNNIPWSQTCATLGINRGSYYNYINEFSRLELDEEIKNNTATIIVEWYRNQKTVLTMLLERVDKARSKDTAEMLQAASVYLKSYNSLIEKLQSLKLLPLVKNAELPREELPSNELDGGVDEALERLEKAVEVGTVRRRSSVQS